MDTRGAVVDSGRHACVRAADHDAAAGGACARGRGLARGWPANAETPVTLTQADTMLLHAAYAQALKSRSEGGIPIGAALGTTAGVVLAVGHNLRVQTGDSTAHA